MFTFGLSLSWLVLNLRIIYVLACFASYVLQCLCDCDYVSYPWSQLFYDSCDNCSVCSVPHFLLFLLSVVAVLVVARCSLLVSFMS